LGDGDVPLTPADIHNASFRKPPLGKRGYDEAEVDGFLDEAEQEFARLRAENRALREELGRAESIPGRRGRADPSGAAGEPAGPAAELDRLTGKLDRLTGELDRLTREQARAEQRARELHAELERARDVPPAGDAPASGVIAMARRTADEYLRDARSEAEKLVADARTKADQLTSEAQIKASTIDSDARHRHTQALNELAGQRKAALADIDRLQLLAQAHREEIYRQVNQRLENLVGPAERRAG
jgi:DivIVA domain-containing protein